MSESSVIYNFYCFQEGAVIFSSASQSNKQRSCLMLVYKVHIS